MREQGFVEEIRGDSAVVRLARNEACGRCGVCAAAGPRDMRLEARNAARARVGDRALVEVSGGRYVGLAFAVYIFPLIGMIAGYFAGARIFGSEGAGMAFGGAALVLAFFALCAYDRRSRRRGLVHPVITRVLREGE